MADKKVKEDAQTPKEEQAKIKVYAIVALALIVLASLAIIYPKSSGVQQCKGILLSSNRDSCLANLALSTKNGSVCSLITGTQGLITCYSGVAEASGNLTLCSKAYSLNSTAGGSCMLDVVNTTGNFSACGNFAQPYRDKCLFVAANKLADPQECSGISNNRTASICASSAALIRAYKASNATYCSAVSNSTNKNFVESVVENSSQVFANITDNLSVFVSELSVLPTLNLSSRDFCYTSIASETHNSAYCGTVSPLMRSTCSFVANHSGSNYTSSTNFTALLQECQSSQQYQSFCTTSVLLDEAVVTRNTSICAGMQNQTSWQCYSAIAKRYSNATYCGYITNSTANSACLLLLETNYTTG